MSLNWKRKFKAFKVLEFLKNSLKDLALVSGGILTLKLDHRNYSLLLNLFQIHLDSS